MNPGSVSDAGRLLITRLLDRYERSRMFGMEAPWPRDVILRLDRKEFPGAFAPDGRDELADLCAAAKKLEDAAAIRLTYHRGLPNERPRELRLGPAEVEVAYATAAPFGYRPLADCLADLQRRCVSLTASPGESSPNNSPSSEVFVSDGPSGQAAATNAPLGPLPRWMAEYLERVAAGARQANLKQLGMSRERFKRDCAQVLDALNAAAALSTGADGWERVVSERIFSDSKRLGSIRATVSEILLAADPRWTGIDPQDVPDVLQSYGLRRKPGVIACAGAAILIVHGRAYHQQDFEPTAHLPEEWAMSWAAGVADSRPVWITTIENEFPFLSYVQEAGGPCGLGERAEQVVYTAGFPCRALLEALVTIARAAPTIRFRHWGDADVGGMRIWWNIRNCIARPVELFRTRASWLRSEASRGREISSLERRELVKLAAEALRSDEASQPDVRAALELIDALLTLGRKVEQERW